MNLNTFLQEFDISGKVWVTSDHHFAHANIIRFCDRPFTSVTEMDEALIANWNTVVEPNDLVIHLGDFTLHSEHVARQYLERLRGHIAFLNNVHHHDKRWIASSIFTELTGLADRVFLWPAMTIIDVGAKHPVTLCHYPFEEWEQSYHGALHLHGHTHGKLRTIKNRVDVGVDSHYFYPILLEDLL